MPCKRKNKAAQEKDTELAGRQTEFLLSRHCCENSPSTRIALRSEVGLVAGAKQWKQLLAGSTVQSTGRIELPPMSEATRLSTLVVR